MLTDTRVTFGQFWAPRTLEQSQRGTFQRFRNRLAMGCACDTAVDNVFCHTYSGIAITVDVLIPAPNVVATVRMVQMEVCLSISFLLG